MLPDGGFRRGAEGHVAFRLSGGRPLVPPPLRFRHLVFRESSPSYRHADLAPARENPPHVLPAVTAEDRAFLRWVLERAGLDPSNYRLATLQRRLPASLRALQVGSCAEARLLLEQHVELVYRAVEAIIIGFTGFFRDPPVFAFLEQHLRGLPARALGCRVWSVGCSDGSEIYSVAMLLAELERLDRSRLLGTDCRTSAVARARDGYFGTPATRQVPSRLRARYFESEHGRNRVVSDLRAVPSWRVGDVLGFVEPGEWDVVLCRNLAIYLNDRAVARLWRSLVSRLRPGGILVVGKAERPLGVPGLTAVGPCVYERHA